MSRLKEQSRGTVFPYNENLIAQPYLSILYTTVTTVLYSIFFFLFSSIREALRQQSCCK